MLLGNTLANNKMKIFKELYAKFLRKRANVILKNFPVFQLTAEEYFRYCYVLERSFAGIVLGRPNPDVELKIIPLDSRYEKLEDARPVPLGYFGEIVYHPNKKIWQETALCGFADQRGRIWCCGEINDIVTYNNEIFYPYCIEPVFEDLFFVRNAQLIRLPNGQPGIKIFLRKPFHWKIFHKLWNNIVLKLASRFEKTRPIREVIFE